MNKLYPIALLILLTLAPTSIAVAQSNQSQSSPNPLVRVVTLSQEGLADAPGKPMLEATLIRLNRAASFKPDIVCLPETFTRAQPETLTGPTIKRLAKWAKTNNCYVICPIKLKVPIPPMHADSSSNAKVFNSGVGGGGGVRVFNSGVLIDRTGQIVGRYDKAHPTENELENNVTPGALNPPVFKTDFGIIGLQICFDVNWHNAWRQLKQQGASIIFFPSAYPADRQLKTLAYLNQIFIVSATQTRAASIYDITSQKLATTGKYRRWAGAVIPITKRLFEIDFHIKKFRDLQNKYGPRVQIDWYHDDDLVTLASLDPNLTVDDLIAEFDLTPHTDYIQRAQGAQDNKRPQ